MTTETSKRNGILSAGGILDRIVDQRLARLGEARQRISLPQLLEQNATREVNHLSFGDALRRRDRINIIAEIKRQSPSKGIIREDFDHLTIAESYAQAGAAAMSVLTEEDFFGGHLNFLRDIHERLDTPLLRKDFILDEYQIVEAYLAGASAILLITAILDDELLATLIKRAADFHLDALVEVHTEEEMRRAAQVGASIIGVNNRDLTTFKVELETSLRLATLAPCDALLVSESGIHTGDDIRRLREAGYQAFLVGEHLMRQADVATALRELIGQAG